MAADFIALYKQEWRTLQRQSDQFEQCTLLIKLFALGVTTAFCLSAQHLVWNSVLVVILWGQDAIWKTYQQRANLRLLRLEEAMKLALTDEQSEPLLPFQFNQSWSDSRAGLRGLLTEYATQGLKPTVAYPYILLILASLIACLGGY